MAIDTSGKWWVGTSSEDIREYLTAFTEGDFQADEFRPAICTCGSSGFRLEVDGNEGAAKRIWVIPHY